MRILIDLQPLQTDGAATRGVGKYTNGLLSALASCHDVIGIRRASPYLVPPSAHVPVMEITPEMSARDIERQLLDWRGDVVLNCSGPFWGENIIISGLQNATRPIVASIFYDVIPWVFPDVYLQDPQVRRRYHNRCVDLYARADLVCSISQHSERDALRFGYATSDTATTISLGVDQLEPEPQNARDRWKVSRSYLLSVSGDEFRKNPELLIAAYLQSDIRMSHSLVIVVSNDSGTGFSTRMGAKYENLRDQDVIILPKVTDRELGALYRDCDAFVFASLYEGFGIPIVEAMQFGKWIISSKTSSLGEVSGPALLSLIEDPGKTNSIVSALNDAKYRLDQKSLDESVPRVYADKFSWARVVRNLEDAVKRRRNATDFQKSYQKPDRPQLFWASPFPGDVSGIAFYSEDLLGLVSAYYDIILVPNTISSFVPTPKTGCFKIEEPRAQALLALCGSARPFVFYNIGNSHFHLELLDLLFTLPGIVLLHDSYVGGLEELWRERNAGLATTRLHRWCWTLSKVDRVLLPFQPSRFRRILGVIARLPGARRLVSDVARLLRMSAEGSVSRASIGTRRRFDGRPLDVRIIDSSSAMLFLGEHAKSLIDLEHLGKRPTHIVPLYCRYRGAISTTKRAELRQKYGIPENAFVITTTGFQNRIKLTDRFVQGCIELQNFEGVPVYAQVLGRFFDTTLEAEVRALLSENNVWAFISGGFVDEVTLEERLALSDVAVYLRSFSTGGPSAGLNDALGMGIPSLVTDDFAFREYPATAVLRVPNCEITEGMILLYRHRAVRQSLVVGGLQYAQEMSIERVASRLCEIFSLHERCHFAWCPGEKSRSRVETSTARVFVDITFSLMNKLRSGLQRVEREIASGLDELDPSSQCFSFVAWNSDSRCFHCVPLDQLLRREDLPPLQSWLAAYPKVKFDEGADLFILGSNWPLGELYYSDVIALTRKGLRISVLIPDLIPIRHRWDFYDHCPDSASFDLFKVFCLAVLPLCSNVLTISNYVRADIENLFEEIGLQASEKKHVPKLHVLKLGAAWSAPIVDPSNAARHKARSTENAYILCVSTLEKRKNHKRLLEAMRGVRDQIKDLDLVLVGGVDASMEKATLDSIRRNAWVHHFDRVDDCTLRRLYEESLFTVYPSLDEGYGLPVIESFRHGKFCLASNAGAIPEAGGEWADYFDPEDVQDLAAKILKYVANPEDLRKRETLLTSYRPASWRETSWQVARVFFGERAKDMFIARRRLSRVALPKWLAAGLFRLLARSNTIRGLGKRVLTLFPSLYEQARRQIGETAKGQAQVLQHPGMDVVKRPVLHSYSQSEFDDIMHNLRHRIVAELDHYVAVQESKSRNPLEVRLLAEGLYDDCRTYEVNALRRLPERDFFEALSILLFKRPLEINPLLGIIKQISRRRLIVLLMCSLLPGRRAGIVGLYKQLLRSAVSKSPFIFSLAKRLYYRIT